MAESIVMKDSHMATSHHGYAVTCEGRVWSYRCLNGRGFKADSHEVQGLVLKGVLWIIIARKRYALDALVAEAFVGPRPSDAHILVHRDGDICNCDASNLKWIDTTPVSEVRPVPASTGYFASRDGQIWHRTGSHNCRFPGSWKPLQSSLRENGYLGINTAGNTIRYVHAMVLEAFIGPCPDGLECCHNDGVRTNNALTNLRWDTHASNTEDSRQHGTMVRGEDSNMAKLTEAEVVTLRSMARNRPIKELACHFGISEGHTAAIIRRRFWKHVA